MSYEITDRTLIDELCTDIRTIVEKNLEELKKSFESFENLQHSPDDNSDNLKQPINLPEDFQHPLDDEIIGTSGKLRELLTGEETAISYTKADKLDQIWRILLNKSIMCLRYFDKREPFLANPSKAIVAYGIDKLEEYHKRYTEFEGLMYGASAYYRDHVFHAIRVWMLGMFCLLKPIDEKEAFISQLVLDGGAEAPETINFLEYISMWTIIALCHDLGYPLEKAEQILDKTRKMMKEFVPNPNVWNNFGYSGTQDSINEYILKFISTKMKEDPCLEAQGEQEDAKEKKYVGRIQPKYYLKYAKSLENFQHGIISTAIIFKMLLYFLESDFNMNDDYIYSKEDARQFYIRREILRAMASHTCPDAYNIHITTFSSLLFLCDELQEWGRKTWNELYTGLNENSVQLTIDKFSCDVVEVTETINMENIEDSNIIIQNICRVFERQYSLYKTTFRDGQHTYKRDFDLKKTMTYKLKKDGSAIRTIEVVYGLPKSEASYFQVNLSSAGAKQKKDFYKKEIEDNISKKLYGKDLSFN